VRNIILGILLAGTAATPLAAQTTEREERQERALERYERRAAQNAARGGATPREQARAADSVRQSWGGELSPQAEVRAERRAVREARQADRAERRDDRFSGGGERLERREDRLERRADRLDRRADRLEDRGFDNRADRLERRADRLERRADRIDDRQGYRGDYRDFRRDQRRWDRSWRRDSRYDWQRYRYSNRGIYSPGRYYAPYRGHSYSRFSIGFFLEPLFYGNRYSISDPYRYRLPSAYPGTRWVRYYDDVLLVDTYTGEVLDVIYDFFW
jgi:Ni/Co efflux regulator RcnB